MTGRESQESDEEVLIEERAGSIVVLTLNRPSRANALSRRLVNAIGHAFAKLRDQSEVGCVIIRGGGRNFCAGGDLTERLAFSVEELTTFRYDVLRMLELIEAFPAPVIAACHGAVVAGGMEIALASDIRVGTRSSRWGVTEVRRAGAFPAPLSVMRLERLLGSGQARALVFRGHLIGGTEAERVGLVDSLVDSEEECLARSKCLAEEIVEGSWDGIAAAKQLMRASWDLDLRGITELSMALMDHLEYGADRREAIDAWGEHRDPRFKKERTLRTARLSGQP